MATLYSAIASDIAEFHLAMEDSIAPIRTFLQSAKAHRQVIQSIRKSSDALTSNFSFTSQLAEIVSKRKLFEQYISNVGNEMCNNRLLCGLGDYSIDLQKFQDSSEIVYPKCDTSLRIPYFDRDSSDFEVDTVDKIFNDPNVELLTNRETGSFIKTGKSWRMEYEGKSISLRHLKGFAYISLLLRNPGQEFTPLELRNMEMGYSKDYNYQIPIDIADKKALREYNNRSVYLHQELQEAEEYNDIGKVEKIQLHIQSLQDHMQDIARLGKLSKTFADDRRRARQAIMKALNRALDYLEEAHPDLHKHMKCYLRTRKYLVYDPPFPVSWYTD